jgi:hypothetical protein
MATGLTIVIGSFLEEDLVRRIEAAQPSATVVYEPALLPVPRYPCDHAGRRRDLAAAELERWEKLTAGADVFFDFDWLDPASLPRRAPGNLGGVPLRLPGDRERPRLGAEGACRPVATVRGLADAAVADPLLALGPETLSELRRYSNGRH